jgi:hypothetical protein
MRKLIGILLIFSLTKEVIAHPPSLPSGPWPVVIFGKVNAPKENSSIKLAVNRIGFHQEELTTHLDAEGHFSFTFTTYVPTDAWIDYRTNFLILLHPGDSLYVEFDGTTNDRVAVLKSAIFKGDASATNESAALFQRLYYDSPFYNYDYSKRQNKIKDSTPSEYMRFCDSVREMAINFQKAYVKKVKPGNEVSNWSRLFIEDDYYLNASIYPDSHRSALVLKKSDWDVPGDYYNFLSQYYDIKQSLISGNAIGSYISKYTYKYIRGKAQRDIAVLNRSMSIEQQDSILIQRIVEDSKGPIIREISLCFFLNDLLEESAIGIFEQNQAIANANITQPFLREPLFEKYFRKKKKLSATFSRLQSNCAVEFHSSIASFKVTKERLFI